MLYTPLTRKAMQIAYDAHQGQVDKGGLPYIFHPYHLAEQMDDEISCCAALLHDVVEDTDIPMDSLAEQFPPKMRLDAKQRIEKLQTQYQIYKTCSEVARNTLECNLHLIEKVLASANIPADNGPGYQARDPEIPAAMKTDFRA